MKKIGLLLAAILLSPLAMAQTAPAAPKAQATQTWYVAPIAIDETSDAQKALTKDFMAQMIKTIKINEYQTGKAVGNTKKPKWLIRTKLIPASQEPLVGKKHPQGLTYGKGNPTQEIVGELLMNGTLVAHIGQGWREPIVPHAGGRKSSPLPTIATPSVIRPSRRIWRSWPPRLALKRAR